MAYKNKLTVASDVYEDDELKSCNATLSNSISGDELEYDTLIAVIDTSPKVVTTQEEQIEPIENGITRLPTTFYVKAADGTPTRFKESTGNFFSVLPYTTEDKNPGMYQYGDPVVMYTKQNLINKFYIAKVTRISKYLYELYCVSGIGLLSNARHFGGIYTGQPLREVVLDVVGKTIPISIESSISNLPIYGWLPVATRRDNLHQILFAMGLQLTNDTNGDLLVRSFITSSQFPLESNKMYLDGTVTYPDEVKSVYISEHTFSKSATGEQVTLIRGELAAETIISPKGATLNGALVTFSDPMHSLSVQGSEILESGVNYAILKASVNCTLTGIKYLHTTRQVTRVAATAREFVNTNDSNEISVTDATLINTMNGEMVADRIFDYYKNAKRVSISMLFDNNAFPGKCRYFTNPFGEDDEGIIAVSNMIFSNQTKVKAEVITNFLPTYFGNKYTKSTVLTTSGTYTVPTGISKIRVVLIGGGQGGHGGNHGEIGHRYGQFGTSGPGYDGHGGTGGIGGKGGKIAISTLTVYGGQKINYTIGVGGLGGAGGTVETGRTPSGYVETLPEVGEMGSPTIFGSVTSNDGAELDEGYVHVESGKTYGTLGSTGITGGDGDGNNIENPRTTVTYNGQTWVQGKRGKSSSTYNVDGGYGGGPAAGSNGTNGHDYNYYAASQEYEDGKGGSGANATIVPAKTTTSGSGGIGGAGGGGGGSSGGSKGDPSGGTGGNGGQGGPGANGCIIVYY